MPRLMIVGSASVGGDVGVVKVRKRSSERPRRSARVGTLLHVHPAHGRVSAADTEGRTCRASNVDRVSTKSACQRLNAQIRRLVAVDGPERGPAIPRRSVSSPLTVGMVPCPQCWRPASRACSDGLLCASPSGAAPLNQETPTSWPNRGGMTWHRRRSFRRQGSGYHRQTVTAQSGAASCQIFSSVQQPADSPLNENHHLEGPPLPWTTPGIQ